MYARERERVGCSRVIILLENAPLERNNVLGLCPVSPPVYFKVGGYSGKNHIREATRIPVRQYIRFAKSLENPSLELEEYLDRCLVDLPV